MSDIPDQALFIICNLLLIKLEFCQTKLLNITLPTSKFQLIVPFLKVEYGHMMKGISQSQGKGGPRIPNPTSCLLRRTPDCLKYILHY